MLTRYLQITFLTEWQLYAQKVEGEAWKGDKLDGNVMEKMTGKCPCLHPMRALFVCGMTAERVIRGASAAAVRPPAGDTESGGGGLGGEVGLRKKVDVVHHFVILCWYIPKANALIVYHCMTCISWDIQPTSKFPMVHRPAPLSNVMPHIWTYI